MLYDKGSDSQRLRRGGYLTFSVREQAKKDSYPPPSHLGASDVSNHGATSDD